MSACKKHSYAGMKICPECLAEIEIPSDEACTTTNYTEKDYRMMALAAGYEIEQIVHYITRKPHRMLGGYEWIPTQGQDFINLIADARIGIIFHSQFVGAFTTDGNHNGKAWYAGHPSPADAMIAAGLECARLKGFAIQKAEAIDHDR